jgi:hypothetical protein
LLRKWLPDKPTAIKILIVLFIFVPLLLVHFLIISPRNKPELDNPKPESSNIPMAQITDLTDITGTTASQEQHPIGKPTTKPEKTIIPKVFEKYPTHHNITATVFWVGESASEDNDHIANDVSAWDSDWVGSFGGVDNPGERNGYHPKDFTPKENPFYIALPYSDFDEEGRKDNLNVVYWYKPLPEDDNNTSIVKNRWVKIKYKDKTCYAQWENTGPFESDDTGYVFGSKPPKNQFGAKAGIDISPAVRDCLKMREVAKVSWVFVDDKDVPPGPWKEIVTTSAPNWD